MPFLLPTTFCDSENDAIVALAHQLIPPGMRSAFVLRMSRVLRHSKSRSIPHCPAITDTGAEDAAKRVRAWVRKEITYTLDVKDTTASQTMRTREGMCTNKANLQASTTIASHNPTLPPLIFLPCYFARCDWCAVCANTHYSFTCRWQYCGPQAYRQVT